MSAAPSWPLISSPVRASLPKRDLHRPRVEFRYISKTWKLLSGFKSLIEAPDLQNAKRRAGASLHPPVTTSSSRTEKARNCLSPNGLRRNAAVPATNRVFVLPPRYGTAIVEIRGGNPSNPHTFLCTQRAPGSPPLLRSRIALGFASLVRNGIEASALTSIPPWRQPFRAGP
jgi:hypothetical protein